MSTTSPATSLTSAWIAGGLLVTFLIVGLWDVAALYSGHADDSVSAVIGRWSQQFPVLPLAVGLIAGHLFWPRFPQQ